MISSLQRQRFFFRLLTFFISLITAAASVESSISSLAKQHKQEDTFTLFDHFEEDGQRRAEGDEEEGNAKPWGMVIGATLLVNIATLGGVIFLIPLIGRRLDKNAKMLNMMIPAFAAGALIATALFLTAPEGLALIQTSIMEANEDEEEDHDHRYLLVFARLLEGNETGHNEEEEAHEEHGFEILPGATWRFGASVLGGFVIPFTLSAFFAHHHSPVEAVVVEKCEDSPVEVVEERVDLESQQANSKKHDHTLSEINMPLVLSILIGDAFHNFCDGVFIGIAFLLCGTSVALTIMAVTLYHELAQEIADYFLLTTHAGLTPKIALILNFAAGCSVMFGGLIVLATDLSEMSIGVLLALSTGVYLHIAAVECLPRVNELVSSTKDRILLLIMFSVGAIPIGLTLLNHTHCEAEVDHDH